MSESSIVAMYVVSYEPRKNKKASYTFHEILVV